MPTGKKMYSSELKPEIVQQYLEGNTFTMNKEKKSCMKGLAKWESKKYV